MQFTVDLDFTEEQMEQLKQLYVVANKYMHYTDAPDKNQEDGCISKKGAFRLFVEEALMFRIEKQVMENAEIVMDYAKFAFYDKNPYVPSDAEVLDFSI